MNDNKRKLNIELQKEFEKIKQFFFPQWDRRGEWKVKLRDNIYYKGKFVREKKRIYLSYFPSNKDELYLLLIHEICHYVSDSHEEKWKSKMLKISERANELGFNNLANLIKNEINLYNLDPIRLTANYIYREIEDHVIENPDRKFREIIQHIAYENGMSIREFLEKFKKSKEHFLKIKEEMRERKGGERR